jgi:hypothetical protein
MSEERDIVERLRMRPTILRKNPFGDIETDRAATKLFDDCHALMRQSADEIERLREENRQLRERSTEAVVAWINETIKRAGEAHILKKAQDGV